MLACADLELAEKRLRESPVPHPFGPPVGPKGWETTSLVIRFQILQQPR
jgi:hypothetical protein